MIQVQKPSFGAFREAAFLPASSIYLTNIKNTASHHRMPTARGNRILRGRIDPAFSEVIQGQFEIHGSLEISDDALVFSYNTKNILGKFSETEYREIPFGDISSVVLKKILISARVIMYPRHLGVMNTLPGEHRSHMIFKVHKADRSRASAFVNYLQYKLDTLESAPASSVPFKLSSTDMGFTEHEGLLYLENEFLVFDLQSGIAGGQKEDRHVIKVEPAALQDIEIKAGAVYDNLLIWPKKEKLLLAIPGNHKDGQIKLSVKRKHREALEKIVESAWRDAE